MDKRIEGLGQKLGLLLAVSRLETGSVADSSGERDALAVQVASLGVLDGLVQLGDLHVLPAGDAEHGVEKLASATSRVHVGGNVGVVCLALLEHACLGEGAC